MNIILNINNVDILSNKKPEKMKVEWIRQVRKKYGLILQSAIRLANIFFDKTEGFSKSLNCEISIDEVKFFMNEKENLKISLYERFKDDALNQGLILLPKVEDEKEEEIHARIKKIEEKIKSGLDPKMHYLLEEYKNLIIKNSQPFA